MRARTGSAGLTLLEVLVALTILSVIVVVLVTSLRVGVRAWEGGERRAAIQQEMRIVTEILTEALSSAAPFRGRLGGGLERVVLFEGEEDEVHFVTTAPPLVLDAPAAPFHAVTLRRTGEDQLRLVERLVPADDPFGDEPHVVLSRAVTALKLEYRDGEGLWQDRWDPKDSAGLPTAVRIAFTVRDRGRSDRSVTFVVPIAMGAAT
jgi:general secretion pathway protein J